MYVCVFLTYPYGRHVCDPVTPKFSDGEQRRTKRFNSSPFTTAPPGYAPCLPAPALSPPSRASWGSCVTIGPLSSGEGVPPYGRLSVTLPDKSFQNILRSLVKSYFVGCRSFHYVRCNRYMGFI